MPPTSEPVVVGHRPGLVLAFVAMPAALRDWLWAAAAGWGSVRIEDARWGTGQLAGNVVTWEGDEPFTGRLVSRSGIGPIANGWGPRIVFPLLVALWMWLLVHDGVNA